jgi:hypothetical protein
MANKMKNKMIMLAVFAIMAVMALSIASADTSVCCERTTSGLYCQDVPASQCAEGAKQVPTACRSTSYCKPGICYDSNEGTCMENTPQLVCNANKGIWSEKPIAQCNLGCCVLGDQAAFVTLTRCKKLSAFLGLKTNYNGGVTSEVQCILSVQNLDKGACVYESEFKKLCKFTTRGECTGIANKSSGFYAGKLCSAEELGTECGPTTKTTCVPGKEEIYFVDSCGNPANIYDASKVNDKVYWTNVKDKASACNPDSGNANSASCGNCNYLLGTFCRDASKAGGRATYGNYVCADLNCKKTSNGKSYKHGESWCVYNDAGKTGNASNSVGSRFYKHICMNGEEILEQCDDYRNQECIEDSIPIKGGAFSQAACRVNRWQDCILQTEQEDCENSDKRDCLWVWNNGKNKKGSSVKCIPKNSPGTTDLCASANRQCVVGYEKMIGGSGKCEKNCECETSAWKQDAINSCMQMGDCGPKINWAGSSGYGDGYKLEVSGKKKAE